MAAIVELPVVIKTNAATDQRFLRDGCWMSGFPIAVSTATPLRKGSPRPG